MTVLSLNVAKDCVEEMRGDAVVVYEYYHAITGKTLWSIETNITRGNTERSEFVVNPKIIYTKENGWSK